MLEDEVLELRRQLAEAHDRVELLEGVIDCIQQGVVVSDIRGNFTVTNPAATDLLGQRLEATDPSNWSHDFGLFLPDQTTHFPTQELPLLRALGGKEVKNQELFVRRPDGRELWLDVSATPLPSKQKHSRAVAIFHDATHEKEILTGSKLAHTRWSSLLENIPGIVLQMDLDGTIRALNQSVGEVAPADAIGRSASDFLTEESRAEFLEALRDIRENGRPRSLELLAQNPADDTRAWFAVRMGALREGDEPVSLVLVGTDITKRKQAERALTESQRQLRSLSMRLQNPLEEERARIARELHDELGQLLTALRLDLSWLESRLPKRRKELHQHAHNMGLLIDSTVQTVRRIATRLRPQLLDDLGPAAAIDWLVSQICSRSELECQVDIRLHSKRLPSDTGLALFRICQEALTNVVRHAQASRAEVRLLLEGQSLKLTVSDNGRGISNEEIAGAECLGLLGLRERVAALGGSLKLVGVAGQGTQVIAQLPLPASAQ